VRFVLDDDWVTVDSAFIPMAIALVVVVHAFAVASEVRIAPAILVILAAHVEAIRDALVIGDGARTSAVMMRIADLEPASVLEVRADLVLNSMADAFRIARHARAFAAEVRIARVVEDVDRMRMMFVE